MKSSRYYLRDILQYVVDVESFTQTGKDDFMADRKTQLAVIRAHEVIGEIVKRLPTSLLETQPDVNWRAIKGFRDILIHQYDNIDLEIVWDAVGNIPALRAAVEALLASLPPEDEDDT